MRHLRQTKRHASRTKRHAGRQPKVSKRVVWFVIGAVLGTLLAVMIFKPIFDKLNEIDQTIIAPIKAATENAKPKVVDEVEPSPVETVPPTTIPEVSTEPKKIQPPKAVVPTKPVKPPKESVEPTPSSTPMAPPVDVIEPPAEPIADEMTWVNKTMAKYGVYANPITRFVFNHVPEGCNADACTLRESIKYEDGTEELVRVTIYFAPYQLTEYILFHEIAHTQGILDECAADAFAAQVLGTTAGSGFYDCPKEGT